MAVNPRAAAPSAAGDAPAEILYESASTRVSRVRTGQVARTVVRKEYLGADARMRLRHETRSLAHFAGFGGVAQYVDVDRYEDAIYLQDTGGISLAATLAAGTRFDAHRVTAIAIRCAEILAKVHRAGLVHCDVNPSNMLMAGHELECLIDFDTAIAIGAPPLPLHGGRTGGTLAYAAPEQSGRTNRPLDHRADLYSLGVVMYELATGRLPFAGADALSLVRDHLVAQPRAPHEAAAGVPGTLSRIILRLLEKEPASRYQSAEGLVHDLALLRAESLAPGPPGGFTLGARDFPARFSAPGTLIGREREIALVHAAFDEAVATARRGLVIEGPPGVGKSALVAELKSVATARGGWFAYGKFDQYQRDADSFDGFANVLSTVGRLLLATPEGALADLRRRILHEVGPNSALLARVPEFATLLGQFADGAAPDDPRQAEVRMAIAVVDLFGVVASAERPIVIALDDVQWAGARSLQLVHRLLTEPSLRGIMIVLACRPDEIAPESPLGSLFDQWQSSAHPPARLAVANLDLREVTEFVAGILRLDAARATELASAMLEVCGGNPFDTVELANAWRDSGVLRLSSDGWRWDTRSLVATAMRKDVLHMLSERLSRLGPEARRTLDVMGCLGGSVGIDLLALASGTTVDDMQALVSALQDQGFLERDPGEHGLVRFLHDRVQETVVNAIDAESRESLHLALCRGLMADARFEHRAAQQFLKCRHPQLDPAEKDRIARLLLDVALRLSDEANYVLAATYLDKAAALLDPTAYRDAPLWRQVAAARHVAFYGTGRADEADAVYAQLAARLTGSLELIGPACLQMRSLDMRGRMRDSLELGLALLAQLGLAAPAGWEDPHAEQRLQELASWIEQDRTVDHASRVGTEPPGVSAAVRILERMVQSAFFLGDTAALRWLLLEMLRLWSEHGPLPPMVASLGRMANLLIMQGHGYGLAHAFVRHILEVGEALRFDRQTAECRYTFIHYCCHWFEPVEESLRQANLSIQAMRLWGDESRAAYLLGGRVMSLLELGPTLAEYEEAIVEARALARRSGNRHADSWHISEQQLLRALQGRTQDGFNDGDFDEETFIARTRELALVDMVFHVRRALLALVMNDAPALERHGMQSKRLLEPLPGTYYNVWVHVYLTVAASCRAASDPQCDRQALLRPVDEAVAWLSGRAADQPVNFLHLLRLVEAERAWIVGDRWAATAAFDEAMRHAQRRHRPWHRALIAERAGRFFLSTGSMFASRQLMAIALAYYEAWGASGKVQRLKEEFHGLQPAAVGTAAGFQPRPSSASAATGGISPQGIDLMGVVRASQALSSETSIASLVTRVTDVLAALTGATRVTVLWRREGQWCVLQPEGSAQVALEEAAQRGMVPLSLFSYVERTGQPLAVDEIGADDRFARDPYFAEAGQRSVLAAPVASHGTLQAVLLLENDTSRGAFNAARLDAVMLIGRQLAVSLENARLYESLEERVAQRTRDLEIAHAEIVATARRAGMAEIANSVLHNVGNVLNSVNTSASVAAAKLHQSKVGGLAKAVTLMNEHRADIGGFLNDDARGKLVLGYLGDLAQAIQLERDEVAAELRNLMRNIGHIKDIVATQQSHAGTSSMVQMEDVHALIEEALHMNATRLAANGVRVERRFAPVPVLALDKPKVLQILVNLIANAVDAMEQTPREKRSLAVACEIDPEERGQERRLRIAMRDQGCGMDAATLERIFAHGFTTKKGGHGFGLHGSVIAARDMGGRLTATSDGAGLGALFTLELPVGMRR